MSSKLRHLTRMARLKQLHHFKVKDWMTGEEQVVICAALAQSGIHAALHRMFPEAEPFETLVDVINRDNFNAWRKRDGFRIFSWELLPPADEVTVLWFGTREWHIRYRKDPRRCTRFEYKSQVMAFINEENLLIVERFPEARQDGPLHYH